MVEVAGSNPAGNEARGAREDLVVPLSDGATGGSDDFVWSKNQSVQANLGQSNYSVGFGGFFPVFAS